MENDDVKLFRWEMERWSFTMQPEGLIVSSLDEFPDGIHSLYGTASDLDEALGGVPFTVFKSILACAWSGYGEQAFIDLLNEPTSSKRHIITFFESEFREYEKTNPGKPFFLRQLNWPFIRASIPCRFMPENKFHYLIELVELERWAKRNPDILPAEVRIFSSEDTAAQDGAIRTSAATKAREANRLQAWQGATKIMVAVALELASESPPKKRTKAELSKMAEKHGGLSKSQIEFLRACLPKELINEGGAPTQ